MTTYSLHCSIGSNPYVFVEFDRILADFIQRATEVAVKAFDEVKVFNETKAFDEGDREVFHFHRDSTIFPTEISFVEAIERISLYRKN